MRRRILISFTVLIAVLMATFVVIINRRVAYAAEIERSDGARLTLIDQNGVVIMDTLERAESMDNHLNRPEIKQLIDGRTFGSSLRFSDTLGENYIYVSKRCNLANQQLSIRISAPLTELARLSQNNIVLAVLFVFVAGIVTIFIAWVVSDRIAKPINQLIRMTDAFATGDYSTEIELKGNDEVAHLANSYSIMRSKLTRTMNSLSSRNAELNAMLDSMTSGIIALDLNQNIILINQQCFDILEIAADSVALHDSVYKVVKSEPLIAMIKRSLSEQTALSAEIESSSNDKVLHVNVQPIRTAVDCLMGTMIVIDDVTQIHKLESVRSEFVSNVTHELKTPLTSILGFVDTLKTGAIKDPVKTDRFLSIISSEAERLNRLISDILLLSEIEQLCGEVEKSIIDVSEVIAEVLDMLKVNIGDKDIEMQFVQSEPVEMMGNRDRIKQLIINLVDNAIKYTESGYVRVALKQDVDSVRIVIADSGVGFDSAEQARLFERFYRIDKARSRKVGGTGLGLSIVKHIVSLYSGEISVQSEKGVGSTFTIVLPKAEMPTN